MWKPLGLLFTVWVLAAGAATVPSPVSQAAAPAALKTPDVLRFRVIANSDRPVDQAIKLNVRDGVLRQLEPKLAQVHSALQAERQIQQDLPALNRAVLGELSQQKAPYRATVILTRTKFPAKAYGSLVLPAGRYEALLVVLGSGQGHNWWCVLYPTLCFIDMGNGLAIPNASDSVPTSSLGSSGGAVSIVSSPVFSANGHIQVSWNPLPHRVPHWVQQALSWL